MAWRYFTEDEMRCRCGCGRVEMDEGFMAKLDALRHSFGQPMTVTSGFRCENHPAERNKKSRNGAHRRGRAADIAVTHAKALSLILMAGSMGFTGIGVKQHGPVAGRFIHVDDLPTGDPEQPRPTTWSYP